MTDAQLLHLTIEEHHAHQATGSTGLRCFRHSPKTYHGLYVAKTIPQPESSASQVLGTAFHSYTLEPDLFDEHYAVMPVECDGDGRTKAVKEARAAFAETCNGRRSISRAEYLTLERMHESLMRNKVAREVMEAKGSCEQSVIWEQAGVECKARFDKLLDSLVAVDLKTASDPTIDAWSRQARALEYAHQSALYIEGRAAVFDDRRSPFLHVVVGTSEPFECVVYEIDDVSLTVAWREVCFSLAALAACQQSGNWDGPCAHRVNRVRLT